MSGRQEGAADEPAPPADEGREGEQPARPGQEQAHAVGLRPEADRSR
jgi:hypothetical protein